MDSVKKKGRCRVNDCAKKKFAGFSLSPFVLEFLRTQANISGFVSSAVMQSDEFQEWAKGKDLIYTVQKNAGKEDEACFATDDAGLAIKMAAKFGDGATIKISP
jgi:hypothetical protein